MYTTIQLLFFIERLLIEILWSEWLWDRCFCMYGDGYQAVLITKANRGISTSHSIHSSVFVFMLEKHAMIELANQLKSVIRNDLLKFFDT